MDPTRERALSQPHVPHLAITTCHTNTPMKKPSDGRHFELKQAAADCTVRAVQRNRPEEPSRENCAYRSAVESSSIQPLSRLYVGVTLVETTHRGRALVEAHPIWYSDRKRAEGVRCEN